MSNRTLRKSLTIPICASCWSKALPALGDRLPRPFSKSRVSTMSPHRGWGVNPMPISRGLGRRSQRAHRRLGQGKADQSLDRHSLLGQTAGTPPSLLPADATQRALMIGLSHEICGQMGIGWNRRLQLFAPAYISDSPASNISRMGGKYGYNEADAKAADVGESPNRSKLWRRNSNHNTRVVYIISSARL